MPPLGVYVPLVSLFVATLPSDPVEKEVIKDLDMSIADIVAFPAEAKEPLCIDLIGDVTEGNVAVAIIYIQPLPSYKHLLLLKMLRYLNKLQIFEKL